MLRLQPNRVKAISGVEIRTGSGTDQVKKRCSIVFFTGRDCSDAYNYLRSLSITRLSSQYELVIINNSPAAIDESYLKSFSDDVKIISPQTELKFVQLCILAAQQGRGKYVVFSQGQIDEGWLGKVIDQLETMKTKIAIPEEKDYILVDRVAFLEAGSFEGLVEKKPQSYHHLLLREMNKYVDVRNKKVLALGCNNGLERLL